MNSRVLLVEDEEALRLFLGDSLRNEGYDVEYARDGHEGLEKATRSLRLPPGNRPDHSGHHVAAQGRIRSMPGDSRGGAPTPILMLTARGQIEDT